MIQEVTVTDPQESITVSTTSGRFNVAGWPVAFTYGHGKNGSLIQCNVFGFFVGIDGQNYLTISYTRPHILDKGKVSKVLGRSIAAARLKVFFKKYFEAFNHQEGLDKVIDMKGIRVYRLTPDNIEYVIEHKDGSIESFLAPEFVPVLIPTAIWNDRDKVYTAARFERISTTTFAKIHNKITRL